MLSSRVTPWSSGCYADSHTNLSRRLLEWYITTVANIQQYVANTPQIESNINMVTQVGEEQPEVEKSTPKLDPETRNQQQEQD